MPDAGDYWCHEHCCLKAACAMVHAAVAATMANGRSPGVRVITLEQVPSRPLPPEASTR